MWQQNRKVNVFGIVMILILWIVGAAYLAPLMESHVQSHGDSILAPLDIALTTEADGVTFYVQGTTTDKKAYGRVYQQLAALHPIVAVRVDLRILDTAADKIKMGSSLQNSDFNPFPAPAGDDPGTRCERLQELEPRLRCR